MARKNITHWDGIVQESNNGVNIWVGVDVHKKSYSVAVLSNNGVWHCFTTPADNSGLIKQFQERGINVTCLVYEAGLTGFGLCRECRKAGIEAMVVAAVRIPRPIGKTAKTDKIDCMKLAEYLAKGLLKSIHVPTVAQEARRAKVRRRNQMASEIAKLKTRIKSFLTVHSLPEPQGLTTAWSRVSVNALSDMAMNSDLRYVLDSYLRELEFLVAEKGLLEKELKANFLPTVDVLQSVPGVGPITSATFRAEVMEAGRFQSADKLSGFLGLAPVISQSGASSGTARLVPSGQSQLRSKLVEAAWILKTKEPWAQAFYNRVLYHSGKAQKAIVALARKLAIILWRLLLENRPYQTEYKG